MVNSLPSDNYSHTFNTLHWVEDKLDDPFETSIDPAKKEALAQYLHWNFNFTTVWDQLDILTANFLKNNP